MLQLKERPSKINNNETLQDPLQLLLKLQEEVSVLSQKNIQNQKILPQEDILAITRRLDSIKEMLLGK